MSSIKARSLRRTNKFWGKSTWSGRSGVSLTSGLAACLAVVAAMVPLIANAQSSGLLPPETQLVAATDAPAATAETFTIAAVASGSVQPDLLVTFTDFQVPAALAAASVVVTQGATLVGSTTLGAGAMTATLSLPAAVGQYTLRVIGAPNATWGYGTFNVCVAPTSTPAACIASASIAGNITVQSAAANPTVSTLGVTLTVATAGVYTFTYADDQFPVALQTLATANPSLALFQGASAVAVPLPASPATLTLPAGTYTLLAIAQADQTAQAGLYSIEITGPAGVAPLLNAAYPVGTLAPSSQWNNPSAQSVTLTVTDYQFPTALASATALITSGAAIVGTAATAAGGPLSISSAPAGPLQAWTFGTPGTGAGSFEVDMTSATASILQQAYGVNNGSSLAYAFMTPQALAAGSYQATANDFQFPEALTALQFAVAQNGAILKQESLVGTLQFSAAAGPVALLAAATPAAAGSGLFDVNVQTAGNAPQLQFDQVQIVNASSAFSSQTFTLGASGTYDVSLTDLMFPAQFSTLALVGTSNGAVLGSIYYGGSFALTATPGNYQFTVIGIPLAPQQYGLYGLAIVNAPPTVTLKASPATVTAGGLTTLSWTTTNASACTASGGAFTGSETTGSGSAAVSVAATTTYTLACTGAGGSDSATATVTTTPAPASTGGGGGSIGLDLVGVLAGLACLRLRSGHRSERRSQY